MKKGLLCVLGSIAAFVGVLFAHSVLFVKSTANLPEEVIKGIEASVKEARGTLDVSFHAFMDYDAKLTTWSRLSVVLVVLSLICVAGLLIAGVMSVIKKDGGILKAMETKKLSIFAFVFYALSVLIGMLFPSFPPITGAPEGVGLAATMGLGSMIYLLATLFTSASQLFIKE